MSRAQSAQPDPCSLLTAAEIKAAVGIRVGVASFFACPGYGRVQLKSFKSTTRRMLQLLVFSKSQDQLQSAAEKLMRSAPARVK